MSPTPAIKRRKRVTALLVLALAFVEVGCASYPERTERALRAFRRGQFETAIKRYSKEDDVRSEFLSGAEAGTAALTAGDWEGALTHLHRAADAAYDFEGRALAGVESAGESLMSWAVNDRAKTYPGEGFERVYVHCGLALAYLAQNRLDDVYVETRRANQLLEAEEALYEKRYRAGGWGHLIGAIAYELVGQPDDAYIEYVRMEEKGVGTELAGRALVRLAAESNREEGLARWIERYGPEVERSADAASIIVLAGVGLAPVKVEGNLSIFTPDGIIPFSGVTYEARKQNVSRVVLSAGGLEAETVVIESVADVAFENLADRQAWMVGKSVARGLLKFGLTHALEHEYGGAGRLAGDIFAFLSERADLRSWLTLPDSWQAARMFVPPGNHELILDAVGGTSVSLGAFELEPGETMLIFARTLGPDLYAHPVGGRRIEGSS